MHGSSWIAALTALAAAVIIPASGLAWENHTARKAESLRAQGAKLSPELEAIASGNVGTGRKKSHPMGELTKRDLILGRRCVRFSSVLSWVALAGSIAISFYLLSTVPWNTRLEVSGRWSGGVSAPYFMLLCTLVHFRFAWMSRKEKGDLQPKARFYSYTVLSVMTVAFLYGQWWLAERFLIAAGQVG